MLTRWLQQRLTHLLGKEAEMSIVSNAFGRVILTEADAKKFKAQATYGRPKAAATQSMKKGVMLSRALRDSGSVKLKLIK
jgi:hypothetical protein